MKKKKKKPKNNPTWHKDLVCAYRYTGACRTNFISPVIRNGFFIGRFQGSVAIDLTPEHTYLESTGYRTQYEVVLNYLLRAWWCIWIWTELRRLLFSAPLLSLINNVRFRGEQKKKKEKEKHLSTGTGTIHAQTA